MSNPVYKRVLLKLSGEVLAGKQGFGIDPNRASILAQEIKSVHDLGVSIGVVIGAGNIFRGINAADRGKISEPYIRRRAIRHLEKGRIVIIAGGTGNPYFSTDTAAALRATELGAEIVLKGTKVDGIYNMDPVKHRNAKKYKKISYKKVLKDNLRVMDMTAITLCLENSLPIKVFNINNTGDLKQIILGSNIGTLVSE
jgi:uridylate kinase